MTHTPERPYQPRWARRVSEHGALPFGSDKPAALSTMFGLPDPALFPAADLAAAATRVLQDPARSASALQYGAIRGQPDLINMLVEKLRHDEGLELGPENVLITSGSAAAIGLAARALLDDGDAALVEAPTFPGGMSALRRTGAELHSVPMGPDGLDPEGMEAAVDKLRARGVRPRLLYTMPTFHNPTGLTMGEGQRRGLLAVAQRCDLMVIEDDAYRDLYYQSPVVSDQRPGAKDVPLSPTGHWSPVTDNSSLYRPLPPSLYALDPEKRVIRTGTFSKILAPGVRLGWALAQPEVINKMMLLKEEGGTNPLAQHVAVEYSRGGALRAHISTLVATYKTKRDAMLAALERHFPSEAQWTRPAGGFFVWVTLPGSVDPAQLAARAREEGVDYMPGERCYASPPPEPAVYLRLSFSLLNLDDIEEAVKRLGRAVNSLL